MSDWQCWENDGAPIHAYPSNAPEQPWDVAYIQGLPTLPLDSLKAGVRLVVPTMHGYAYMKAEQTKDGFVASNGTNVAFLKYSDRQECWVTYGAGNLRAIQKLTE